MRVSRYTIRSQCMGGDVAGRGNPGNPGSDGASPYQGASHLFSPIVLVLVLVLVLDFLIGCRPKRAAYASLSIHDPRGVTSLGGATRETPVRTEPHPTKGFAFPSPNRARPRARSRPRCFAGSPGENGRSVTLPPKPKPKPEHDNDNEHEHD
jgi:hypothetical protein